MYSDFSSLIAETLTFHLSLRNDIFLLYSSIILEHQFYGNQKLVTSCEVPSGTLTIGAHESQCTYRLPPVLREFRSNYPQVQLVFRPIISDKNIQTLLVQGILDAAFVLEPPIKPDYLVIEHLVEEKILVLSHPQHRLACLPEVTPSDLDGETILATEQGCRYRQIFEQSMIQSGAHPGARIEFASIESIKQCVIAGLGIAVLPEMTVMKEITQRQISPLHWKSRVLKVSTQVAWHKDKWISPALKAFLDITRKTFRT